MRQRNILPAPILLKIRDSKKRAGPLPDRERVTAKLTELRLDIGFEHPHRGHYNDDREDSHQNPQNGQGRTELVSPERAQCHEKTLLQLCEHAFAESRESFATLWVKRAHSVTRFAALPRDPSGPRAMPEKIRREPRSQGRRQWPGRKL